MCHERLAVLASVPAAWGTYAPAVRFAYTRSPAPLPVLLFALAQYAVASAALIVGTLCCGSSTEHNTAPAARAGAELGAYLFIGNWLQLTGQVSLPATRVAFLVQTTTLLVPLLQAATAEPGARASAVPARTWLACVLAFAGVMILSSHPTVSVTTDGAHPRISLWLDPSDGLVLGSTLLYSLHVVRLSALAPGVPPLRLATAKALTECTLALTCLVTTLLLLPNSTAAMETRAFTSLLLAGAPGMWRQAHLTLAVATVWCGAVPIAYTMWAQSYGQRSSVISPTHANLIYTTQPLWSTLAAWALLDEVLSISELVGAAAIGAALWLTATARPRGAPLGRSLGDASCAARFLDDHDDHEPLLKRVV